MRPTVGDVAQIVAAIAPPRLAEEWDNVGLQAGRMDWPVQTIWVALDPAPDVMHAACQAGADLLITHHPLIFKPLSCVDTSTPEGQVIAQAVLHQTAVFSAHTNLDSARAGLNDLLARKIGLTGLSVLVPCANPSDTSATPTDGLGRIGTLDEETTLAGLAGRIKNDLALPSVKIAGRTNQPVRTVAVCTGSGGSLLADFLSSAADVYVTGDLGYHHGRAIEAMDRGAIDIGHFASEHLIVAELARRLRQHLARSDADATVTSCTFEKDPFTQV